MSETINGTNNDEKDFLALSTEELKKELHAIFFDKSKRIPEKTEEYQELINQAVKIMARLKEKEADDKKKELLAELAALKDKYGVDFSIVAKGRGKAKGKKETNPSTEKEMITTKMVDLKGAVVSVTVGKKGAVAKPKEGEATDTYDFFQELSRMNEGKAQKDRITRESLSKMSPAEIAETFADYIAKVKAQAA